MSASRRELRKLFALFNNFLAGLTETEYNNLMEGKAIIKYVVLEQPEGQKGEFRALIRSLVRSKDPKRDLYQLRENQPPKSKDFYIGLCRHLEIDIRQRDTIALLIGKIAEHISQNKVGPGPSPKNGKDNSDLPIGDIVIKLETMPNRNQATVYLNNHKALKTKTNLLRLSRALDVYIERDLTNKEIIDRIVDSVVVAKLRSLAIRGKKTKLLD